jgi:hypothetical protein
MMQRLSNPDPAASYDYLLQTAQMVVNSGADPKEVEAYIAQLAPLYERSAPTFQKQSIYVEEAAPRPVAEAAAERQRILMPSAQEMPWWEDALVGAALFAIPPVGALVNGARAVTAGTGRTVGIGPQVNLGLVGGVSLGTGLIISNQGKLGWYGSVGGVAGFVASLAIGIQVTIIGGGVERFTGWSWGVGVAGGEVIVGNGAALLDMSNPPQFIGITVGGGIGIGIPVEVFITAQHTWQLAPA